MRPRQTTRAFKHNQIRIRLAELQKRFRMQDEARQIIHNEIEAASLYWFIQGGGVESDFEQKFNEK